MPGRKTLVALVLAILSPSPTPAVAQVINGESNYEDNSACAAAGHSERHTQRPDDPASNHGRGSTA